MLQIYLAKQQRDMAEEERPKIIGKAKRSSWVDVKRKLL